MEKLTTTNISNSRTRQRRATKLERPNNLKTIRTLKRELAVTQKSLLVMDPVESLKSAINNPATDMLVNHIEALVSSEYETKLPEVQIFFMSLRNDIVSSIHVQFLEFILSDLGEEDTKELDDLTNFLVEEV